MARVSNLHPCALFPEHTFALATVGVPVFSKQLSASFYSMLRQPVNAAIAKRYEDTAIFLQDNCSKYIFYWFIINI